MSIIKVSDVALGKIEEIVREEPAGTVIRVQVSPG